MVACQSVHVHLCIGPYEVAWSLTPSYIIYHYQVADLANEDTPQLYAACGRGPRSSLRVLRHGLEVSEMAVSELPGNPTSVWTVKKTITGNSLVQGKFYGWPLLSL